ncbi:MAG: DUF2334 domain-containing protein [Gemmatimonadota bacterium]
MTGRRQYVVELHDIGAHDPGAPERMLACVPAEARASAVLLVVPRWGGTAEWRAGSGARVVGPSGPPVLHGYTHSLGPSLVSALWTGTEREGEFARLSDAEASARLSAALRAVAAAFPAPIRWFCPPRWQASDGTRRAVHRAGLGLMQRDSLEHPDGRRIVAPALWFDDGARWLPNALGAIQHTLRLRRLLPAVRAVRVALHPRDVDRLSSRRAIDRLFAQFERDAWEATSLDDLSRVA